ncbi:sensor histidine kinase [Agrobacterium vitis]|uniref:sensor histidine kinase n=1 Tax=Agrobacterium vitis TaxID=373 RepID=UPI000872F7B0|nr:sensor histidine kinase [Agrobacterium vitis]MCE6076819.1 GAF domain-containing protein [Agrobacterium vitis]MCM2470847.1 sensor histidine kinase [Agrobacterium vitis]MUO71203.1 GAF domain-containing protein [Agrobacterium vitis]MUO84333.1 GAF domain-containing protein [Agrobacterium vitis]
MSQAVSEQLFSEVFITDQLEHRRIERADFLKEKIALQDLASRMVTDPDAVLPRFVELAMQMTGGTSAGLSIFDQNASEFKWLHLCGELAAFEGASTPRNYSPCGVTLDVLVPVLCRHPEWAYSWVADAQIALPEVLLVPLLIGGKEAIGTLWIASGVDEHFTSEHARVASELATFVGIAMHVKRGEERIRQALEAQETLTREMNHRVKNLFALTEGMLRQTLRASGSKEEMAEALSGRLRALSSAYSLVLRDNLAEEGDLDLRTLTEAILSPHVYWASGQVSIVGDRLICTERAATSIALVLNELATNAVKYGALGSDGGAVSITWRILDGKLELDWVESNGPLVTEPVRAGFGNKLVETTIVRQYRGSLQYKWLPSGLSVAISIPKSAILA